MAIRDRIKSLRRVKAGDLRPNPRNWREHPEAQREALQGVLDDVGYADACLARELPDGSLELVDGHLRAGLDPEQKVPVLILDVTEAEAAKLLATLDPMAAMAEANEDALSVLLEEIETDSARLQELLDGLAEEYEILLAGEVPAPEMPSTVAENVAEMNAIRQQRKEANESTANQNDTERYLVIVYPDRETRDKAVCKLGLPADERYVNASDVRLRARPGIKPIEWTDRQKRQSSGPAKTGAGG